MSTIHEHTGSTTTGGPGGPTASSSVETTQNRLTTPTRRVLAVIRIAFGFTFLWAFFD